MSLSPYLFDLFLNLIRAFIVKLFCDQIIKGVLQQDVLNGVVPDQKWPQLFFVKISEPSSELAVRKAADILLAVREKVRHLPFATHVDCHVQIWMLNFLIDRMRSFKQI